MKKIALLLLVMSCLLNEEMAHSQIIVSGCFQPIDLGVGMRFDYQDKDLGFGIYTSLSKGNFKYENIRIDDHFKTSAGITLLMKNGFYVSAGFSWHTFGFSKVPEGLNKVVLDPFSVENGVGINLGLVNIAIRYDFIKTESSIDIGITLFKNRYDAKGRYWNY